MMGRAFQMLSSSDYLRRTLPADELGDNFWEWLHFAVRADGIDVVINFSMAADPDPEQPRGQWFACWTILVRDRDGWLGDVERFDGAGVDLGGGRIFARCGSNCLALQDHAYRIQARLRRQRVSVDLALFPDALPAKARVDLGQHDLSWFVVPKLRAWGTVDVCGQRHLVRGAPAYHDHNWGRVGGADLTWDWGYAHGRGPKSAFFVRLLDRRRLATYMQGLFLWHDGKPLRVLRDGELSVDRSRGEPRRLQTVPGVCSLLLPTLSCEVPAEFCVAGGGGGDRVSLTFRPRNAVRIAAPDGSDEGLLVVHECGGKAALRGVVGGLRFEEEADGFFEFVTR
jgi:hypothetical protein